MRTFNLKRAQESAQFSTGRGGFALGDEGLRQGGDYVNAVTPPFSGRGPGSRQRVRLQASTANKLSRPLPG